MKTWLAISFLSALPLEAHIELSGFFGDADDTQFLLSDTDTKESSRWLKIGQSFGGYTILSFDRSIELVTHAHFHFYVVGKNAQPGVRANGRSRPWLILNVGQRKMSQETHRRYLEQSALREAQKAIRRRGGSFKKEDFASLRIQTFEPWKRIFAIVVGVFFGILTVVAVKDEYHVIAIIFFSMFSLFFVLAGVLGYKKPVEAVIDATADAAFSRLLDAIF